MDPLRLLAQPKRLLAMLAIAASVVLGLMVFGETPAGELPTATVLLAGTVVLSLLAIPRRGTGGWVLLAVAWGLFVVAYGAAPPL